jgi:predicted lipid-binding transport protein (Tim44 family)
MSRGGRGGVFIREQAQGRRGSNLKTGHEAHECGKETSMLGTLVVVLVVLWLIGMVTSYTLGGLIHLLLLVAIVVVLARVIQGRNPLKG